MKTLNCVVAFVVLAVLSGVSFGREAAERRAAEAAAEAEQVRARADQGHAAAQNSLGVMYDRGRGVPRDDREAVRWYRLAADQGFAAAQFNLGNMYYFGRGAPRDDREALRWWGLAADQGYTGAQYTLGNMYAREAVRWYRLAADQGHAGAQFRLGCMATSRCCGRFRPAPPAVDRPPVLRAVFAPDGG